MQHIANLKHLQPRDLLLIVLSLVVIGSNIMWFISFRQLYRTLDATNRSAFETMRSVGQLKDCLNKDLKPCPTPAPMPTPQP